MKALRKVVLPFWCSTSDEVDYDDDSDQQLIVR